MAIDPRSKSIKDLRALYHRRSFWLVFLSSIAVSSLTFGFSITLGQWQVSDPLLYVFVATVCAMSFFGGLLVKHSISRPFDEILAALAHKSGELTTSTPPNPNTKQRQRTGMNTALQLIYNEPSTPHPPTVADSTDQLLTTALNHTSCGVILMNSQGDIISANKAAPIAHTQEGQAYLALDFLDDISLNDWRSEIENSQISAERQWRRVSTNPDVIHDQKVYDMVATYEKGALAETVVVLFDRSEQYMPEEEDLNFIAFAAHELRGPITVIRGYLDVLEQEFADRYRNDEAELMQRLIVSANRLSSYINNILNVARFDRHHLKTHLVEDTIAHIYSPIADDMQLRASSQHRLLNVTIPDDLPAVAADRGSIQEVIGNLIDNAIKYSFEGGVVTVTASTRGDFVEISVSDNGVGMPAGVVNNLFHKFYRSHRSREAVAGTGIGLYICKAFVESHGGSITARSKENEGSTFSFTLPIYATVKDKLLEDGQLNQSMIRHGGGWIKNHAMYRN